MKKILLKHILNLMDLLEIHGMNPQEMMATICSMKNQDKTMNEIGDKDVEEMLEFANEFQLFSDTHRGIDLSPCATIFATSENGSMLEALALFELYLSVDAIKNFFINRLEKNEYQDRNKLDECINNKLASLIIKQTSLFESNKEQFHFNSTMLIYLKNIIKEKESECLLSHTLLSLYTKSLLHHENQTIEYRNQKNEIITYPDFNEILTILPRSGIPVDRDETRHLQGFFKDTLFHEFDHRCALCGIDLPHLLIASHIKPFRDCGHIIECVDHDNGLLLCRNHDYLFDQGYISFDEEGHILINKLLLEKPNFASAYGLSTSTKIEMNEERKQFMNYHRTHLYIKK
ncbi:MAG: HNH endonuclease [Erysipelotrichaceae bacterium]